MKELKKISTAEALLYEYKKALNHLKDFLLGISDDRLKIVINPADKELESIQGVLTHTIFWGYYYLSMIEMHKGITDRRWSKKEYFDSVSEYINELDNMYKASEELLSGIPDAEMHQFNADFCDYENLIEHGIVHVYRHKTQIEKFVTLLS